MKISYSLLSLVLLLVTVCSCVNEASTTWNKEASGVWKMNYGKPENVTLTSELDFIPKIQAINEMDDLDFPLDKSEIKIESVDGKTYIRFPLDEDEKIYGLGLHFKSIQQRGKISRLHVDHYGGSDNGRTHAPVPFFVSSKGYGAFINSARYIDVYCGTGVRKDSENPAKISDRNTDPEWTAAPYSDNLEILVPAEGVEIVLFAGPTMLDAVRRFNLYHGGGALPPRWGLGFWHRVPLKYTDKQVVAEVEEFEKHKFPLSVIGLEPGWQSNSYPCTYEWDKNRFPDVEQFVKAMSEKNVKLNLWMNPGIHPDCVLGKQVEPYSSSHTEWCGLLPDYTLPKVQEMLINHWKSNQIDLGISGYKMDENDGYDNWIFPDVATFPSGTSAEQMRQIYGSLMQNTQMKMFRMLNKRTYGLVRAGNAGTNSFPYVIYNDYYDHRSFITALINSSFNGVLWTPEVRSSDTAEEWLRRMQTVCFSPIAQLNAWSDGTKPWSFPEVEADVNMIASLRMQLIPYLYSTFAEYCFHGTPPIRAMNLEEGYTSKDTEQKGELDSSKNPYAIAIQKEAKDQFMLGENLLVAPLFAGETERQVILPRGKWYDFYTGELAGESEVITVAPGLDKIPLYVKDGGIIPMYYSNTATDNHKKPLIIRHYGTKPSVFHLYDDDGVSFDYEKGIYTFLEIQVSSDSDGKLHGILTIPEGKQTWSYNGEAEFQFYGTDLSTDDLIE